MKVLLLTPKPHLLVPTIEAHGDEYVISMGEPHTWPAADFVVSYGYRRIIEEPYLSTYEDRMINIHMSILPWNRGDSPNFWSWFDHTPKGVSIHLLDEGIDTGNIIQQMNITKWIGNETLRTSYEFLEGCATRLFALEWHNFRRQNWFTLQPLESGSYHQSGEKKPYMDMLPLGWDTPTEVVANYGASRYAKIH